MIRKQSAEEQIATMQHLINFGVNENSSKASKPIVEFKRKAANGKTYGIIRESTKYYIMEAPQKDTEVLAEDFDYIGGFNNRKENEYSSYSKASNALDLKIMSINETVNKENRVMVEAPTIKADWEDKLTESMRKEIDRFKTITNNVAKILKEDKGIGETPSVVNNDPEAPAKNPSEDKKNQPYEVMHSGVANGEKDFKKEQHNHQKAGTPYDKDGKSSLEKNMQSGKKPSIKTDAEYLTNDETYEPKNNVASQHKTGKNPIGIFENKGKKIRLKLTEEQVLAWNDNKNYMDMSSDTHVGSSDPFTNELGKESNQTEADTDPIIKEGNGDSVVYDHPTDQNKPTPGTTNVETEDGDPFVKSINEVEGEELTQDDLDSDFNNSAEKRFDDDWNNFENGGNVKADDVAGFDDVPFPEVKGEEEDLPEIEVEFDDDDDSGFDPNKDYAAGLNPDDDIRKLLNHDYDDDDLYENRRNRRRLSEDKLNVWGKHPAWRKQPMTTPPNKEVAINGAREWDDESAQGEEPYAQQIGDGSPFSEVVKEVTEAVLKSLYGNKKKV